MGGAARAPGGARGDAVRRLILFLLAVAGCAQPGTPPGGPPDDTPPKLLSVRPDSNALNVRAGAISFQFDEVVSEVPTGARALADVFLVSPSRGPVSVSWHRSRVDVTPEGGLRPNVTYTVQLLPGITDLSRNVDSTGVTFSFSTGPSIATGQISGIVFDWLAAKPAARAVVAAISLPDSLAYTTRADSLGGYDIRHVPPGRYLLRAFVDQNNNRLQDSREIFDSVTVGLRDSLHRDMLAIQRDSIGPGILEVAQRDSVTLHVTFDRAIDTAQVLTPSQFTLKSADSTVWPVRSVLSKQQLDQIKADSLRRRAVEDSVRQAAIADSIRQADSARVAAEPTRRRPGVSIAPPPGPQQDTTKPPPPKPSEQIPGREADLKVERPLPPTTSFRLVATDLRSVTGATRTSTRVFTTPRPKPAADSTRARSDTGTRRPRPDTGRVQPRPDAGSARPRSDSGRPRRD